MPLIKAENLVKSFGPVRAVDGLSVTVNERSVWGLIGPNGAGKTTTIKMILGLSRPDGGQVEVFDEDPWDNPGIRKRIGVIFDRPFFPPHEKALDYLKRACRIYGVPEVRAVEVLKQVDLLDARGRPLKALSMGMLQKFAIAHSMIQSPSLVVADEMTANLDPQTRSRVLDLVLRLSSEEKVAFLLSSHILSELDRVCDHILIMDHGRTWASGNLSELSEKYRTGRARSTLEELYNVVIAPSGSGNTS